MADPRLKAVADVILAHQPEPEDIDNQDVSAARNDAAEKQAQQFLAMLDAAINPPAENEGEDSHG